MREKEAKPSPNNSAPHHILWYLFSGLVALLAAGTLVHKHADEVYGYRKDKGAVSLRGYLGKCLQVAEL